MKIFNVAVKFFLVVALLFTSSITAQDVSVTMASPLDNASYNIGDDIHIVIDVSNSGSGTVTNVQLYQNGFWMTDLSPDTTEYVIENAPNGIFSFLAVAIVDSLTSFTSDAVTINIGNTEVNNKITNGEFNNTTWPWRFDNYGTAESTLEIKGDAGLTDDASGASITVQNAGTQFWEIQLMQEFQLKAGHTYSVTFSASATAEKAIQIAYAMDYDPWASYWWKDIVITSTPKEFGPFIFECENDDPKVMFKFILGGNDIPMLLDAVKIVETSNNAGVSENISLNMSSPANNSSYETGDDVNVSVDIINTGDDSVVSMQLFQNGFWIADLLPDNTNFIFENAPNGVYNFSASAIDNNGKTVLSDTITVNVGGTEWNDKVINGEFNNTIWPWRFDNYVNAVASFDIFAEAGLTDDSSSGYLQIQNVGDEFWAIQLMQQFKLEAGHTYDVYFTGWATAEKAIQVVFAMDYDPYASHWWQDIVVSAEPQEYGPYTYECGIDDPKVMFKFILGGNDIPMFLDAVKVIDRNAPTDVEEKTSMVIDEYRLEQNYPNPFNPTTTIGYQLKETSNVKLFVYDILGNKVANLVSSKKLAGYHEVNWDAGNFGSGVYFYRIITDNGFIQTKKLTLLK
ncbi:MAG: carbohydrate binding domain-containing protein [Melioribacteraceae bacterium]|nr:carbohydrate binding domain-containing protein [Melioribacteraceae bacterium]